MNILMLIYEYPPVGGGGGVAAQKLAEEWVSQNHRVDVVTTHYSGLLKEEKQNGVSIYRVPVFHRNNLSTASFLSLVSFPFLAKKQVKKLFQRNHYDIINTHFAVPTGLLGCWASQRYGIPQVLSLHGGDIYDPTKKLSPHKNYFFRKTVSRVLNQSHQIVSQSTNTKNNVYQYYHYTKEIPVIPLGYKPYILKNKKTRSELGLREDIFYLLSVGRMVKRKGFDYLLSALSLLPDRVHLILIGEGPEEKNLKQQAKDLKIQDRVIFTGRLDEETKFQYFSNVDLYVLSSLHEGYGIVLQEAMDYGLPIVSTNNGGQTDFLEEGENALLVPIQNSQLLAEAIQKIFSDPLLRQKMAYNNIQKIKNYSISKIAEEYLKLFRKLLL